MSKKLYSLILCSVVLAVFAGLTSAADVIWNNTSADGNWSTAGNWSGGTGVPTIAAQDKAKVIRLAPNDVHIKTGMAAECTWLVVGDNASGGIHMTGGTFNVSSPTAGDSWSILAYGPSDVGVFTMDGGTVTTGNRFFVGFQGNGTLNMNGGTMNIGGTFGIGYGEGFTTASGTVNLAGGTINVTGAFQMSAPAGCVGKLDLTGGTLNLTGDKRTIVQGYKDSGYIVAFNGLGNVNISYDGVTTTVTGATNFYKARGPNPANNDANVPPSVTLSWSPGLGVLTHDIYFGADANSVSNANTSTAGIYQGSQNSDVNTFNPAGLELSHVYYWRIDEVNSTDVYKGDLWQFTVASFALIDDFEKYADTTAMLASWSNGSTGATLSLAVTGGHDNAKTMKFDYSNAGAPFYSEAQTIDIDYDWTIAGVLAIDIWYKGNASNASEQMYAAIEDNNGNPVAVVLNSDPDAAKAADWSVWRIKLSDFTGVNLANVKKFYIGFGSRSNPAAGGAGTVYFDDIELYPSRCLVQPETDLNGDCVVDFKDFVIMATNWLKQSTL